MVSIRGLRKTFNAGTELEVRALRGIDLDIDEGSFVVVIGMNGSGKSSLLSAIAGEIIPDEGTVMVANRDVTNLPVHARAPFIGRVFQDPFAGTAPELTVAENISIAAMRGRRRGLRPALTSSLRRQIHERIEQLGMGLEQRLGTPIGALSGGQRQALTLLMATWRRPEVLLLDEHTAALDPKSAEIVAGMSARIIAEQNLTALMVTHSMQQAVTLGDRLILMHGGEIVMDVRGTARRVLRSHTLLARFDELRREDALTPEAADMLRRQYV